MNRADNEVILGDCLPIMETIDDASIDLAYLDPPFFTNKRHRSVTRDRAREFSFSDVWSGLTDYAEFMAFRLRQVRRVLKDTGSIFVHCDKNANFLLRALLDDVFGEDQFRSEIIWTYRRWSNSAKGLLPAHQTIFFYSKTDHFKFNRIYCPYSETTNVDQILQLRSRDEHGISAYAFDDFGEPIYGSEKKGVPLSDVWEIPFLNPKAKERTGYPTQKPVLLLERVIEIATESEDIVLDPFCGSGTTLVAAKLLGRRSIGIDSSREAVDLARSRLSLPQKTESALLQKGRAAYANADEKALSILTGLDCVPVQRNAGIDAFLKMPAGNSPIPIRVQRENEPLSEAVNKLTKAAKSKHAARAILVRTHEDVGLVFDAEIPDFVILVDSASYRISGMTEELISSASDSPYSLAV